MTGPAPAVARVRSAIRAELAGLSSGALVLAAVSGGRDSVALADALAFEGPRAGLRVGALVVDHQLQAGSAGVASEVAAALSDRGLSPVEVLTVSVAAEGGPEAAARDARYTALSEAATRLDAAAVFLGHTLDDQAETVLLGLARGSGARSLSGMPARRGLFRRPLLDIDRRTTGEACTAVGLKPWDDPHNEQSRFARIRVRSDVLPVMEANLGPGVAEALARTSRLLRDDDEALEAWAERVGEDATVSDEAEELDCDVLARVPAAVRRRVLRQTALAEGTAGGALREEHLRALDALVVDWHGQGPVDLPGGIRAIRSCGRLRLEREGDADRDGRSRTEAKE